MKVDLKALKARADIVAVMRACGVPLEPKGANFVALCPFHREKTPSFTVDPKKRIFKCFGCSVSGDVFKFVKLKLSLSLADAIRHVHTLTDGPTPTPPTPPVTTLKGLDEDAADPAPQTVLDRVIAHWQRELARNVRAQQYLTGRKLWHPELVRALRIGFSSGSLTRQLPGGGKLRRQLHQIGIVTDRGTEFFYGRVVFPIFADGVLVGVYGRAISTTAKVPHLYLKGPHRGVFNATGVFDAEDVILAESPLDALSVMTLGFTNVTTSYGTSGFTADLRALFLRSGTKRVYCAYDADPAGDLAADQLAHDLAGHGVEVRRVALPDDCKDTNDFVRGGGTRDDFQALLKRARRMLAPQPATVPLLPAAPALLPEAAAEPESTAPAAVEPVGASPEPAAPPPAPASPPPPAAAVATLTLGDRTYAIESAPEVSSGTMRVVLRATRQGRTFVDTLNLYADQARAKFVSRLVTAFRGQVPKKTLEDDFFAVLDEVEAVSRRLASEPTPAPAASMTPTERDEALAFLRQPDLIRRFLADIVVMGVVGEEDNVLLVVLVATSRLLAHPLSVSIVSGSSAGKSWMLNRILDLFPLEDVHRFTRMSPRALFYDEPGRYKHKILHVEEAIGAKDADLGVRSMQSERRLANLATMTDPKTGKLKTQETIVEGPLTYMTSSVEPLDYETSTRSFEVTIDESAEQTDRIVRRELFGQSLAGVQTKLATDAIVRRHQNAQRLLERLVVVNPYADQLTFPKHVLRLRREIQKYIGLMNALALLFQHQRPIRTFVDPNGGGERRYVEVTQADIAIANRLMAIHLTRVLSDLPGSSQMLLLKIQEYVTAESEARGVEPLAITFNRRQVRDWVEWPDRHLISALDHLVTLEFVEVASGSFGKRYVYTLTPAHRVLVAAGLSIDERIEALGLTPVSRLKDPAA